jgi:DNA-directed RNA polymerase beta subunit
VGVFCPAETPEGHNVGFVKNMSIGALVTTDTDRENVLLNSIDVDPEPKIPDGGNLVMLNYVVLGSTMRGSKLVECSARKKTEGIFHPHTSVIGTSYRARSEFRPTVDVCQTLLQAETIEVPSVKEGAQWHELHHRRNDRIPDVEEAAFTRSHSPGRTSYPEKTVYMEIHPSLVLGVLASCIPFPDHNQSPRNSRLWQAGRRTAHSFFRHSMDTGVHVMDYGQRPIASSKVADMMDAARCRLNQRRRGYQHLEATIRKTPLFSTRLLPSAVCSRALITTPETLQKNHRRGRAVLLPVRRAGRR